MTARVQFNVIPYSAQIR